MRHSVGLDETSVWAREKVPAAPEKQPFPIPYDWDETDVKFGVWECLTGRIPLD
jgi:hypothetical protein